MTSAELRAVLESVDRRSEQRNREFATEMEARHRAFAEAMEQRHIEREQRQEEVIARNTRIHDELIATLRSIRTQMDDMGDEIRANTRAVLKMLDRFSGPGEPA